jgi:hypothetical protein
MGTQSSKIQKEINRITDEFDLIQESTIDFDISQHLATIDDLPDLGQVELHDYEADLTVSTQRGMEVLESLVDLYLGEFPNLRENKYIKEKMRDDALVYAETLFLQKMTRRNFITQLKQVDNGEHSSRMHEVINQTVREIRENSKFASSQKTELEKYYKDFRTDLIDVLNKSEEVKPESESGGSVVDSKKLNDMINEMLKSKKQPPKN